MAHKYFYIYGRPSSFYKMLLLSFFAKVVSDMLCSRGWSMALEIPLH